MLIIFEGNEGSGKTTLSNAIADIFSTKVLKRSSFKDSTSPFSAFRKFYDLNESCFWDWRFFLEMIYPISESSQIVCDRSFITQEVYHKAFVGRFPENPITFEHSELYSDYSEVLSKMKHLVVYVQRDSFRTNDDLLSGQWDIDPDISKNAIDGEYEAWLENNDGLNILRLDNNGSIDDAVKQILKRIR